MKVKVGRLVIHLLFNIFLYTTCQTQEVIKVNVEVEIILMSRNHPIKYGIFGIYI
jgi:hypothetical protein